MMKTSKLVTTVVSTVLLVALFFCFTGKQEAHAVIMPKVSETVVFSENGAVIDASNTVDGYVMVKYNGKSTARLKVLIKGPKGTDFNYNLNTGGNYEVFALSDGNGEYTVGVYQNTEGTKYITLLTKKINVKLNSEYAPFLIPNQYVNYTANSKAVQVGSQIANSKGSSLEKIAAVYEYVSKNISYDQQQAATVQSGYVPDVDQVLSRQRGICFDFASLMASMLRSQGIPTKLVIGYAGTAYHAWLDVYTPETGWIEAVVFFDGKTWKLMDPTFASGMKDSAALEKYIGDGKNYKAKFYN
ncbi:MAG: transglutaminase-like domain-containing protein [Peptococcaceae bacterium]|nr:transglutaminase-like domain-containing protein [Peptococcaceae bacterium]